VSIDPQSSEQRSEAGPANSAGRPRASSRPQPDSATGAHDPDADARSVARAIALRRLTTRAHTRHELDQALQAKNVAPGVKEAVLDQLQEVGLIDDASFALDWVTSRQQRRHLSRRVLSRELQAKGVDRSDIDRALDDVGFDAEFTAARDLVERRRTAMSALPREVQYRRLAGLLGRRGFDTGIITRVLADALGE
jgi:regulatory protein